MDELDQLQEQDELRLKAALDKRKPMIKSANGMCVWCHDEPISDVSSAFCSAECGEDYEKWKRN